MKAWSLFFSRLSRSCFRFCLLLNGFLRCDDIFKYITSPCITSNNETTCLISKFQAIFLENLFFTGADILNLSDPGERSTNCVTWESVANFTNFLSFSRRCPLFDRDLMSTSKLVLRHFKWRISSPRYGKKISDVTPSKFGLSSPITKKSQDRFDMIWPHFHCSHLAHSSDVRSSGVQLQ